MNAQLDSNPPTDAEEMTRLIQAARDAMTDDLVTRLAATAGDGMDLLDRVNRSGVASALPHLATMANNGDLERLAQLARVYGSAQDALTDDMVSRMSEAVGGGLDLLDQINRADLAKAIPVIARLVHTGDLDRLADMARLVGSAQDAMTDDMVSDRVINMLEHLDKAGTLDKLVDNLPALVNKMEMLEGLLNCLEKSAQEASSGPPAAGGLGGLWSLMRAKENQETLRFLLTLARNMQQQCAR
ncbi:MAG: hypothetical protein J0J02_02665 [Thiobacillus sp.]|nr:hypothetical protein [Thiobacillus sp.]